MNSNRSETPLFRFEFALPTLQVSIQQSSDDAIELISKVYRDLGSIRENHGEAMIHQLQQNAGTKYSKGLEVVSSFSIADSEGSELHNGYSSTEVGSKEEVYLWALAKLFSAVDSIARVANYRGESETVSVFDFLDGDESLDVMLMEPENLRQLLGKSFSMEDYFAHSVPYRANMELILRDRLAQARRGLDSPI